MAKNKEEKSDDDSSRGRDEETAEEKKEKGGKKSKEEKVEKKIDTDTADQKGTTDPSESGILTEDTFASLGVCETLMEACERLEWKTATKIQSQVLPEAFAGRDIIGLAETGSGKTGAFVLPILQGLLKNPVRGTVALLLTPTRELAFQIHQVVQALGQAMGATSCCVVGGVDRTTQAIALARYPHFIIATPGRLLDHLKDTKGFNLRKVRYLVLDEADRMLSMDFEEELHQILDSVPDDRQTLLFSATMTSQVQKLERASLKDPVKIEVSTKFQTPKNLVQHYLFIPAKYKDCYLTYLINEFAGQSILVFCATCNNTQRLALMLRNLGFPAVCLHGQMTQPKRLGALHKFSSGARSILLCTDVASRGLDLPAVDLVINFDLPNNGKEYVHRVGRTARAGKSGQAIAMVTQYDVEVYQRLEGLLGRKLSEYKTDEQTVLILLERVSDAQRLATRELKEQLASSKGNGRRKPRKFGDDDDAGDGDEKLENIIQNELKRGYQGSGGRSQQNNRGGRGGGSNNRGGRGGGSNKRRRN